MMKPPLRRKAVHMAYLADDSPSKKSKLRCRTSGNFSEWLARAGGSLAITTYTSGLLVLVTSMDGRLRFRTLKFTRPMGLALDGNRLALAVRRKLLMFERANETSDFRLRRRYNTGRVDCHDVAFGQRGIYFANTRYNAVARVSTKKNFVHCWQPSFITGVVRGDRCHLNGIAMQDGRPKLVTAFCATGQKGGWREQDRFTGGVVIDVEQDEVVATGLCMPHSPRWHQGNWWLCDSGQGLLCTLRSDNWKRTDVCELPGFTRGLGFVGDHALIGLSKIRRKHILDAPPVRERVKNIQAGVALVNLKTGQHTGTLEFLDKGKEVFEVVFLPGTGRPRIRM